MKRILLLIMFILVVGVVQGLEMCQDTVQINTNCTMITPYLVCSVYNYSIYNINGSLIKNESLKAYADGIYQFNFTEGKGDYIIQLCDYTTREISVQGEDNEMLAAIILLCLVSALLIYIGVSLEGSHASLKILFLLLGLVFIVADLSISSNLAYSNGYNSIGGIIDKTFWAGIILLIFTVFYFMVLIIKNAFAKKAELDEEI